MTIRARALRISSACARALLCMSFAAHSGCATATKRGARMTREWANEIGSDIEGFNMDTGSGPGLILSEQKEYEEVSAHELHECVSTVKHMDPDGVCWMSYSHYKAFIGPPGFVTFLVNWISPEACTWKSGHKPKHE
jgi:hypothetical protein